MSRIQQALIKQQKKKMRLVTHNVYMKNIYVWKKEKALSTSQIAVPLKHCHGYNHLSSAAARKKCFFFFSAPWWREFDVFLCSKWVVTLTTMWQLLNLACFFFLCVYNIKVSLCAHCTLTNSKRFPLCGRWHLGFKVFPLLGSDVAMWYKGFLCVFMFTEFQLFFLFFSVAAAGFLCATCGHFKKNPTISTWSSNEFNFISYELT